MDKTWMSANRATLEYQNGVEMFLKHCYSISSDRSYIKCPCLSCGNTRSIKIEKLREHLICNGVDQSYKIWVHHEESCPTVEKLTDEESVRVEYSGDNLTDGPYIAQMVEDVADDFDQESRAFESFVADSEKPIYPNCKNFTKLSTVIRLFNFKSKHRCSDIGFTELLEFLKELLPEENEIPSSTKEAKKILGSLGMGYKKIHACPNDCILYRKEFSDSQDCPICNESRWKKKNGDEELKGTPSKVLWYLPIIPRFIRLFRTPDNAKNLTWHSNARVEDGKLRHPADSLAWKKLDSMWPEFEKEPRNLRLGLSSNGINPHSTLSTTYSCWHVIIIVYNLPPWLCTKRKFMFLSLMIPGPRQPGNDIDVYLEPLVDDLKSLWGAGVEAFDGYKRENFTLRAALLWTINDFPAYGNLSGYSVKGYHACPICEEKTFSQYLKHSKKVVYLGHRRFLPRNHVFRRWKKAFSGVQEFDVAPEPLSGVEIEEKLSRMKFKPLGKINKMKNQKNGLAASKKRWRRQVKMAEDSEIPKFEDGCWKKKSIFFQLEYWKYLLIRHTLDVMHIEKNICDNIIGTLLNMPGKTKDGVKAHMDLAEMGIRSELTPKVDGKRTFLPPACYSLTKDEKRQFCQTLSNIKVPTGYAANISNYVSMDDLKLVGLKSHDCHILMQHFLPVAIQSILPINVRDAITRLCMFFNILCSKVVDVSKLDALQRDIVLTMCLLEQYFPPSFFVIMGHLVVHLVRELKLCGPNFLRWMFPFERNMKVLKGFVRNHYRPEGSIVESYIVEEAIDFCSEYFPDLESIGLRTDPSQAQTISKGITGGNICNVENELLYQAHRNVLQNTNEVQPFINEHMEWLTTTHKSMRQKRIQDEHHRTFIDWFREKIDREVENCTSVSKTLQSLSGGPSPLVFKHSVYLINGFHFSTQERDTERFTQNSGVSLIAETMQFSSAKDKKPIYSDMIFYGIIKEIWEIDYDAFRIPMFLCDWVESNNGVKTDKHGFTFVNFTRLGHKAEPFILASQAKQVFYVTSRCNDEWSRVFATQAKDYIKEMNDEDDSEILLQHLTPLSGLVSNTLSVDDFDENNKYSREDGERIWIDS